MTKITRKQLSKFDIDLNHAKNCEHAFSRINELTRLSFSLGDDDVNNKILDALSCCYDDIYDIIHDSLPIDVNDDEK